MTSSIVLRIASTWQIRHIKTVIEKHIKTEGDVQISHFEPPTISMYNITFSYNNQEKCMCIQPNTLNPLGSCTYMSMYCNDEDVNLEIMTKIAKVFGGYLTEDDCTEKCEVFDGMFNTETDLLYFLQYAILNNEISTKDLVALNKSIHEWYDRIDPNCHDKMKLFDLDKK